MSKQIRTGGVARCAAALFLLGVPAAAGTDVFDVLRAQSERDPRSAEDVLDELEELGDRAIPDLMGLALWGLHGPTPKWEKGADRPELTVIDPAEWWGGDPDGVSDLAAQALGQCSQRRVIRQLAAWLEEERAPGEVLSAVRLIGTVRATSALDMVLDLASLFSRLQLRSHPVRREFLKTLTELLREDALSLQTVQDGVGEYNVDVLELLTEAIERADDPDALFLVVQLFGFDRRLDVRLIGVAGSLASRFPWRTTTDVRPYLRRQLDSHDVNHRVAAVRSLALLADPASFDRFAELLEDPDPKVQQAADWALQSLTGNHLKRHRDAWGTWYLSELNRFEAHMEACDRSLDTARPAIVLDAMRNLGQHALFRHQVAPIIAEALRHPDSEIVATACLTLERIGSCMVVPDLVDVLFDPDETVRNAARTALQSLTGRNYPADPTPWEKFAGI